MLRGALTISFIIVALSAMCQPGADQKWPKLHGNQSSSSSVRMLKKTPRGFNPIVLSAKETGLMNNYAFTKTGIEVDTSLCIVNQITGLRNDREYLWFTHKDYGRADSVEREVFISPVVTNADYFVLQSYVLDSIFRTKLKDDLNAVKYGVVTYSDDLDTAAKDEWLLNWEVEFDVLGSPQGSDDPDGSEIGVHEYVQDIFYPYHERFYHSAQVDHRKLSYRFYWIDFERAAKRVREKIPMKNRSGAIREHTDRSKFIIEEVVPILRDTTLWYRQDLPENYQRWLTENYTSHSYYKDAPVIGITGYQAWAYCKWQEININNYYKKKADPFGSRDFKLELPRKIESEKHSLDPQTIIVPEVNNAWWTITNSDYYDFLLYTSDSIVKRVVLEEFGYDKGIIKRYEANGEVMGDEWFLDPKCSISEIADPKKVRAFLSQEELLDSTNKYYSDQLILPQHLRFLHYWWDHKSSAILGEYKLWPPYEPGRTREEPRHYYTSKIDSLNDPIGLTLDLGYENSLGYSAGVRSHEDRSRFIIQESASLYPGINCRRTRLLCNRDETVCKGCPDKEIFNTPDRIEPYDFEECASCPIQTITWNQARAYYHWYVYKKKGYQKLGKKNPTQTMLPTKEQWEKSQKGEKVVLPARTIEIPAPVFRYTF